MQFIKTEALNPYNRQIISNDNYQLLIDFLQEVYPSGFKSPTDIYIGTDKIEVENYDTELKDDDIIIMIERPALPVGLIGGVFITWLANIAISMTLNFVIGKLFAPNTPDALQLHQQNQASSVYNLNNSQNQAKLGQIIPVIYGTVKMYPAMINQPYFKYIDNDEYLFHLLCVGHGSCDIESLFVGTQNVDNSDDIEAIKITSTNFADIETFIGDSDYKQLTNTLDTPQQLELPGFWVDEVGAVFTASHTIVLDIELDIEDGDTIVIDEVLGGGTTPVNEGTYTVTASSISGGETTVTVSETVVAETVDIFIYSEVETELYPIDSDAATIEIDYHYPNGVYNSNTSGEYHEYSDEFKMFTYNSSQSLTGTATITTTGRSNNAIRKSASISTISTAAYVSFKRTYGKAKNTRIQNTLYIKRVKELYAQPSVTDYGDITLLWVKIKATNAISAAGQLKVNGFFSRQGVDNDLKSVLTDIYTNTTYGGGLSSSDLDFPTTAEEVNCAFDSSSTIWDAMKSIAKAQKYTVYPVGQDILLKKDEENTTNSALYNETNIIKNSLKVQYFFKEESEATDSVECTYRASTDWKQEAERYPATGNSPQIVDLFGVTTSTQATAMATYLYKQDESRRKVITFDTDIQGLVPQFLDKILISHASLLWGESGFVDSVSSTQVTLSEKVTTAGNITFRDIDGSISAIIAYTIISDYVVNVVSVPSWVDSDTPYTVGTPKEYLVMGIKPKGNTVSIECVNYDSSIYS